MRDARNWPSVEKIRADASNGADNKASFMRVLYKSAFSCSFLVIVYIITITLSLLSWDKPTPSVSDHVNGDLPAVPDSDRGRTVLSLRR